MDVRRMEAAQPMKTKTQRLCLLFTIATILLTLAMLSLMAVSLDYLENSQTLAEEVVECQRRI